MSNYRIKTVEYSGNTFYYPERKFLWVFWRKILVECGRIYNLYYSTNKEKAISVIENDKKQREKCPKITTYEYID